MSYSCADFMQDIAQSLECLIDQEKCTDPESTAAECVKAIKQLRQQSESLRQILFLLNQDKDGGYFICEEGEPEIEHARRLTESEV